MDTKHRQPPHPRLVRLVVAQANVVGEDCAAHGLRSALDQARPGAFDAAKMAREFRELRGGGVGADGLAGAVKIKAACFVLVQDLAPAT